MKILPPPAVSLPAPQQLSIASMTTADLLPATVLKRKAVVYVRQSTQGQVQSNLEGKRRHYELVDVARQRGFRDNEVIDDDLGRSVSGFTARPSFERLVAELVRR
jgi:hypothetical protein